VSGNVKLGAGFPISTSAKPNPVVSAIIPHVRSNFLIILFGSALSV
jgi:hypothetical protein